MSGCLIVGGTGMLAGVALTLAERGWKVAVIAREGPRLRILANAEPAGRIVPVAGDWDAPGVFAQSVELAIGSLGSLDLAVVWMHQTARAARAGLMASLAGCPRVLAVCSSATDRAQRPTPPVTQRIWLGAMVEPGGPRWLMHEEIVAGVLLGIDHPDEVIVRVGRMPPLGWS